MSLASGLTELGDPSDLSATLYVGSENVPSTACLDDKAARDAAPSRCNCRSVVVTVMNRPAKGCAVVHRPVRGGQQPARLWAKERCPSATPVDALRRASGGRCV